MLAELAIVRHENQAFGIIIQTAHVENAVVLVADDIAQGVASLRILHGAQHTLRLIQSERDMIGIHGSRPHGLPDVSDRRECPIR